MRLRLLRLVLPIQRGAREVSDAWDANLTTDVRITIYSYSLSLAASLTLARRNHWSKTLALSFRTASGAFLRTMPSMRTSLREVGLKRLPGSSQRRSRASHPATRPAVRGWG